MDRPGHFLSVLLTVALFFDIQIHIHFVIDFIVDKLPQVRDGDTGDWIGSFEGHKGAVWSAKIDALTRTVAITASGDFTAKLWCASTGKELHEFKHRHVVRSADFSAVGQQECYPLKLPLPLLLI